MGWGPGWGVLAALLANVLYSGGFVAQKRALARLPEVSARHPVRLVGRVARSPLWLAGALALAAGFGAQLVVYRTLPIAVAQGLFVGGLVLLPLLSSRVLGERTSGRERYAIGAVLLALLMVVLSLPYGTAGPDGTDPTGGTDGAGRGGWNGPGGAGAGVGVGAPVPLVLLVCLPTLVAAVGLYAAAEGRARRRHRPPPSGVVYGVAVGLLYGVSSLAVKGLSSGLPYPADGSGTGAGALLGTPYPYLLLCTGAFGLVMSQAALQRCRASLLVPVSTTVTCVFTVALGTFVFDEELPDDPVRLVLRIAGTALAVSVLLALSRHEDARPGPEPPTLPEPPESPGPAGSSESSCSSRSPGHSGAVLMTAPPAPSAPPPPPTRSRS
ncbi:hypothetical protein JNUCC64_24475 [Streptomyces sp. JNUCC 64]